MYSIKKFSKSKWALFFDLVILAGVIYILAVKKESAEVHMFSKSSNKIETINSTANQIEYKDDYVKKDSEEVLKAKNLIESFSNKEADSNAEKWASQNGFNLEILAIDEQNKTYSFEAKSKVYDWDYEQAKYWPAIQKQIVKPQSELSATDIEMITAFNSSK
jgi:hypothetical protein